MSSTITRHITETEIHSKPNLSNSENSLHLNWMDNTIGVNSDITGLEGNISDIKNERPSSVVNVKNGSAMDELLDCDTLDEPIVATLMRDIRSIYTKLKFIIIPISLSESYRNVLKDWDLWGPLIVTTFLALTLHHNEETIGGTVLVGPHFAHLFVLIWLSNLILSLNYKLLNSCRKRNATEKSLNSFNPTTFQLLCVFGYCLSPPSLGIIILKVISILTGNPIRHLFYHKLLIGIIMGFLWPTFCSVRIIAKYTSKEKRALVIYPIALFYFVLSWALITTH